MERRILGLSLTDRWTNERIRRTTQVRDWVKEATKRKLRWARRLRNLPEDRWAKIATTWIPYNYSRRPGRPESRWRDDLTTWIGQRWWSIEDTEFRVNMARHID